jgi:hypothetical protein
MENTLSNGPSIALYSAIIVAIFKATVSFVIFILVLGKVEGDKDDEKKANWHGHISVFNISANLQAITVAPEYRR